MRHLRRARDAVVGAIEGFRGVTRIRELEQELGDAHELIGELRIRLAEATRPPAQFARMRQREAAVGRFARLRLAAPRRARQANGTERVRDLSR